jgi:hypothetical protein
MATVDAFARVAGQSEAGRPMGEWLVGEHPGLPIVGFAGAGGQAGSRPSVMARR